MLHTPDSETAAALAATDVIMRKARQRLVKEVTPLAVAARDSFLADVLEPFTAALAAHFLAFADHLLPVIKADAFGWDPDAFDWDAEAEDLQGLLEEWLTPIGVGGFEQAIGTLGLTGDLGLGVAVPGWIRAHLAVAIKDIMLTTRTAIGDMASVAVERGYSIEQLVRGVPADGFGGLRGLIEGWTTGRATTIALTETATVWNMGTIEGYRASGLVDQVTVLDGVIDAVCAAANGATWTLDEALDNLTAHPRCFPGATPVVASGVSASYSRWYEGDLVVVKTASGHELSATPNHPVLTGRGWVALGEVEHGDDLVRARDPQRVVATADPDHDHVEASIAEVAHALPVVLPSVPSAPEDFHGDVADGDVHVVRTHGLLDRGRVPAFDEPGGELALGWRDVAAQSPLAEGRAPRELVDGDMGAADRGMGGGRDPDALSLVGLEPQTLGVAVVAHRQAESAPTPAQLAGAHPCLTGELSAALAGQVAVMERPDRDLGKARVSAAVVDHRDPTRPHVPAERVAVDADHPADLLERLAGLVQRDRVVDSRRVGWSGHVFNLETAPGWYVADGYIVHNCQRAFAAVVAR